MRVSFDTPALIAAVGAAANATGEIKDEPGAMLFQVVDPEAKEEVEAAFRLIRRESVTSGFHIAYKVTLEVKGKLAASA